MNLKLCIIESSYKPSNNRVMVGELLDEFGIIRKMTLGVIIKVTNDFNLKDPYPVIWNDTYSVQYRPKAIYVNTKGEYFVKLPHKITLDLSIITIKDFLGGIKGLMLSPEFTKD